MANTKTAMANSQPYRPSWIDRLNHWIEKLPMSAWIFHVLLGILLILVQLLFLWLEEGLQSMELMPVIIFNGFAVPILLGLIHLLDTQAVIALNSMKPVLDMTQSEFDLSKFKLSNMPARQSLAAGLSITIAVIILEQLTTAPIRYTALEQFPVFSPVFHIVDKSSAFLMGAFFYHTTRQLRLINAINMNHVHINLFHLRPLQAFSRITAMTAVGLLFFVYVWVLINPELLTDPLLIGFAVVLTIMAVSIFVWPLFGVHRLMEIEKEKVLHEIDLRFESVFSQFNQRLREDDHAAIEKLNGTISSLEVQYRRIKDIPTWPWRSETAQIALSAIALPLILMILRVIVERAFGL